MPEPCQPSPAQSLPKVQRCSHRSTHPLKSSCSKFVATSIPLPFLLSHTYTITPRWTVFHQPTCDSQLPHQRTSPQKGSNHQQCVFLITLTLVAALCIGRTNIIIAYTSRSPDILASRRPLPMCVVPFCVDLSLFIWAPSHILMFLQDYTSPLCEEQRWHPPTI